MLERSYPFVFFAIVLGYCLLYAPFGINETDGGFLTGLGWQVLNGKTLYLDIVYVRPPLPVWSRALELKLLPETWSILGERWIFYWKVALYTWLAADVLAKGERRWLLAIIGFIVSVHSYPACAWHTTEGILWAVLAVWLYAGGQENKRIILLRSVLAGVCLCAALLCKQSFYPLFAAFPLIFLFWKQSHKTIRFLGFYLGLLGGIALFIMYLSQNNILDNFLQMTGSAATGGQAFHHGVLDYLRINPVLALVSALLLAPMAWRFWTHRRVAAIPLGWKLWLAVLLGSYVLDVWKRQDFTAPFASSRLLFLTALLYVGWQKWQIWQHQQDRSVFRFRLPDQLALLLLLLAVSWSASVSWGYNLPILLATPWVFAVMEINEKLKTFYFYKAFSSIKYVVIIAVLLGVARFSYEYVYRDGLRSAMTVNLGGVFPRLQGVYSSPETEALYRDLAALEQRYGANFEVLPAFPLAHFLTNTRPVLPLDWVVRREMGGQEASVLQTLKTQKTVVFVQKSFADEIEHDPELELTRQVMQEAKMLAETPGFWVIQYGE